MIHQIVWLLASMFAFSSCETSFFNQSIETPIAHKVVAPSEPEFLWKSYVKQIPSSHSEPLVLKLSVSQEGQGEVFSVRSRQKDMWQIFPAVSPSQLPVARPGSVYTIALGSITTEPGSPTLIGRIVHRVESTDTDLPEQIDSFMKQNRQLTVEHLDSAITINPSGSYPRNASVESVKASLARSLSQVLNVDAAVVTQTHQGSSPRYQISPRRLLYSGLYSPAKASEWLILQIKTHDHGDFCGKRKFPQGTPPVAKVSLTPCNINKL